MKCSLTGIAVVGWAITIGLAGSDLPAHAQAATSYTVVELGRLPGMDKSYPNAMIGSSLADIQVIGNSVLSSVKKHGFYWSKATGLRDIGVLGVGTFSVPSCVNGLGKLSGCLLRNDFP